MTGLLDPEATNGDRLVGHNVEEPEIVTHVEAEPAHINTVRRSQRIKENPGPALDPELIGDNNDLADVDYA